MEEITASDDILVEVVGILQDTSLFQTDLNAKGRAFEQFISKYFRGDVGQYFTPRNVVHAVCQISDSLKAFSPQANYIDPACGSGGFLLELLTQVRKRLAIAHQGDPLLAQRLQLEFARDHLFGIETNEKIARVAMMDMVIHDDGSSNIRRADALDDFAAVDPSRKIRQGTFDYVLTNPPFGDSIDNRTPYYDSYQLGGAGDIARGKSQRIEVLFIERCLDLLSEEGLLAIVLPDSALTNIENIPVNDFILSRAIYLGALSLPQHAFSPFGSDVKTSVFFFRKSAEAGKYFEQREEFIRRRDALYQDTTLSPAELSSSYGELREEYTSIDYPIMLVHVEHIGHTATGRADENDLPSAIELFQRFVESPADVGAGYEKSTFWWNVIGFLDLISKLNVEAYNPAYFAAMAELEMREFGEIRRLADICLEPAIQSGVGSSRYQETGVPVVKTADVVKRRRISKNMRESAARIGFIKWEDISDHVSEQTWRAQGTKQLQVNDILVQNVAHRPEYIGDKITLVDSLPEEGKALALNKFLIIRPDPNYVRPGYLVQYLASDYGKLQMQRYIRGMTAQIYETDVRDFLIYLPPPEVQDSVADAFVNAAQELRTIESRYQSLLDSLDNFEMP